MCSLTQQIPNETNKQEHRTELVSDVKRYASLSAPLPPVAPSCLIMGPPLCGKTTLAKRLAEQLDMVYIDMEVRLGVVLTFFIVCFADCAGDCGKQRYVIRSKSA